MRTAQRCCIGGEAGEGDAEQDGEGGGLGRGGHEADDGSGCALVDVGGPDVEGRCGDLEAEADDDQREREKARRAWRWWRGRGRWRRCGGAGGSEGEGDAVEEEGGGEGAEQEVLDGGLGAGGLALAEAGEDVGRDGGDLEADEDHEELDRAGHEHHAGGAEEEEGEVLAGVVGVAFEVVERAEQGDKDDGCDEEVEEDGEGVDLDGAEEGVDGSKAELIPAGEAGGEGAEDGEPAEGLAAALAAGKQGSASMMRTPVRVRMYSGRRARTLGDI